MKKYLFFALLFAQSLYSLEQEQGMSEPYISTRTMPVYNHGWFSYENQITLDKFFLEMKPQTVIEVGTWLGSSAIHMAKLLEKGGKLYAVDTWLGSEEHMNHPDFKVLLPNLYLQFLSNVKHHGVATKIIPIRMSSLEAAFALDTIADIIYIDASHDTENVYKDLLAWYPHVRQGGILCGDDWGWNSVSKGVQLAAEELGQTIHFLGNFWYFDPKP